MLGYVSNSAYRYTITKKFSDIEKYFRYGPVREVLKTHFLTLRGFLYCACGMITHHIQRIMLWSTFQSDETYICIWPHTYVWNALSNCAWKCSFEVKWPCTTRSKLGYVPITYAAVSGYIWRRFLGAMLEIEGAIEKCYHVNDYVGNLFGRTSIQNIDAFKNLIPKTFQSW